MSYDPFSFDGYQNSSPEELLSSDNELLFGDQDLSSIDIFLALSDQTQTQTQTQTTNEQQNPQTDSLISPPTHELQTLNLGFHGLDCFCVKTEEFAHPGFEASGFFAEASPQNLLFGPQNAGKFMQRSLSINSFEQKPLSEFPLFESQSFQSQPLASSPNGFLRRRVCSTGDLQSFGTVGTTQRSQSSPLASENCFIEETNNKVGKYNAEERKEKISKYKAKRALRNFNKTIKYACRKTLADNRPRIRGRFARNDEPDLPKASSSRNDDDEWLEGLHEEEEPQFVNSYGPTQFQYYGF